MNYHTAKPEHEVAYRDLCCLIARHKDKMTPLDMLAVAANLVGKIVAMQDQTAVSTEMAMQVVAKNIEHGNQQAIAALSSTSGMTKN